MLRPSLVFGVSLGVVLAYACSDGSGEPKDSGADPGSPNANAASGDGDGDGDGEGDGDASALPECGAGEKLCSGDCIADDDPSTGCAASSCAPCHIENASASCDADGMCALDECDEGYADCDGDAVNGCEGHPADDVHNCEACGNECDFRHGHGQCNAEGGCTLLTCDPGWANCAERGETFSGTVNGEDVQVSTGDDCETDITSTDNCGDCGVECDAGEVCAEDPAGGLWSCVAE